MKIGVSSYSFNRYRNTTKAEYTDLCRIAKEIGFDAIEFVTLDSENPLKTAGEIRECCEKLGLEISAYTVGANFMSDQPEEVVNHLFSCIDVAQALGAPLLRHDVCYSLPQGETWESAIPKMVPYIRRVTEYAKAHGIRTCSENHGYIFQDSLRVKTLIDAVADENYRWLVDMGNFLCADEAPLDAVRVAAPYAIHVHAKDFIFSDKKEFKPEGFLGTRGGNLIRGTILGHGIVPIADCVKVLKNAGYNGTLSLEFEGLEDNLTALQMGYRYLRAVAED